MPANKGKETTGTAEAEKSPGAEERTKLMIASDIHGSAYYCRRMLEAFRTSGAERLLLLGDIL